MKKFPFSFIELGQNKNVPTLLFLHGFMGQKEDWLEILNPFLNSFQCVLIDLPGHGNSPLPTSPFNSFKSIVEALAYFIKKNNYSSLHLIGYSMGGRIALQLALDHPDLIKTLTLESFHPGLDNPQEALKRLHHDSLLFQDITEENYPQFLKQWYLQPLFGKLSTHPHFLKHLQTKIKAVVLGKKIEHYQLVLNILSLGHQNNQIPRLQHNLTPILYFSGEEDLKYQLLGKKLEKEIPNITFISVPGVGHNIHFQNPHIFKEALLAFLFPYEKSVMLKQE